jgi:hypothetical protein
MKNMKNTKADKNLPGTYKLTVTTWDGRGGYDTYVTKPLTITRPIVDETLVRKFVEAGLYRRGGNVPTITRIK